MLEWRPRQLLREDIGEDKRQTPTKARGSAKVKTKTRTRVTSQSMTRKGHIDHIGCPCVKLSVDRSTEQLCRKCYNDCFVVLYVVQYLCYTMLLQIFESRTRMEDRRQLRDTKEQLKATPDPVGSVVVDLF
jgi:hypothetical protein